MTSPISRLPPLKTAKVVARLPRRYLEGIGLVVANWARLEAELLHSAYLLLRVDRKKGRLVYHPNRPAEIVDTIRDLMLFESFSLEGFNLKEMQSSLVDLKSRRDLVAHSVWLHGPKRTYMIQATSGSTSVDGIKIKLRLRPEGIPLKPADLLRIADDVQQAVAQAVLLRLAIQKSLTT